MTAETAGHTLGGFRLVSELGRGGMGVVYLAEQLNLGRKVALKVIAPQLSEDPAFTARFEREARLAASIDHPNVVPVFEAGSVDGQLYLAMRYVDGTDLSAVLAQDGRLESERAGGIAAQVGAALDAAHGKGLIHRDVKPGNVLLTGEGAEAHAYLTDFGLTKEASSQSAQLTNTGQWVGTVDYVAPEQIDGRPIDARTDVYSLGCVLFQMLAGRLPYEGTAVQKMFAHSGSPTPSLESVDTELARRLDPVIARAMAKDPDQRFKSAGDLGRAAVAAAHRQKVTVPERSVAVGVAAIGSDDSGIATQMGPSKANTTIEPPPPRWLKRPVPPPLDPPPAATVSPVPRARARKGSRLLAPVAIGVALVFAVGAGAFLASRGNDSDQEPTRAAAASKPTRAKPAPASEPKPEIKSDPAAGEDSSAASPPQPAERAEAAEPVGVWEGSAVQTTPGGRAEPSETVLTITSLDTEGSAGRLEGQPPGEPGCGGSLTFLEQRGDTYLFTNTETKNVSGCVDVTSVAVTPTSNGRLSFKETWTTDVGRGTVRGTLNRAG